MLDSLSSRVSQMNEKMYDFEQNKRNNLIFYGVPTDLEETSESLAINIQRLIKEKMLLKREMIITQVKIMHNIGYWIYCILLPFAQATRDDMGPAISGRRPVIVTFENFK